MEKILSKRETDYPWIRSHDIVDPQGPQAGMLLVDIRTPGEFEESHIPNSKNVPLADLEQALPHLKSTIENKPVVLVCRTQNRVKVVYNQMVKAGLTNCQILEGGMTAWVAAGHPVVRGEKGVSLERQV